MTPNDRYEQYLDEFGARLHRAAIAEKAPAWRGQRTARYPVLLALSAGVAAIVAAVALLAGPDGGRLDVVARANAALAPSGQIAHIVLTHWIVPADGAHVPPPLTTEQWSASDPARWRMVQDVPPGTSGDAQGPIVGREEFSYANGAESRYIARRNTLNVVTGVTDVEQVEQPPSFTDPLTRLRSMLADGRLTDAGTERAGGRTVRKLTGRSPDWGGSSVTYLVDPTTFAPISGSVTFAWNGGAPLWHGGPTRSTTIDFTVDTYELLPDTAANERLLTIQTTPPTKVTTTTEGRTRRTLTKGRRGP